MSTNQVLDTFGDGRSEAIYRRLTDASHPAVPTAVWKRAVSAGDVVITGQWSLVLPAGAPAMLRTAARDLAGFLKDSFGVRLRSSQTAPRQIRVVVGDPDRLKPGHQQVGVHASACSGKAPVGLASGRSRREHVIHVSSAGIEIVGASEWGAACGLYHLQRLLRLRQAPALAAGTIHAQPTLEPSLTCLAFKRGSTDELDYPAAFDENYLLRIARAGYTGFHFDPGYHLFYRSNRFPELDHPQADRNIAMLKNVVERARNCALDVFLTPYVPFLPVDHPLFRRDPAARGSEIVAAPGKHVLCTGQERVRRFYAEQTARLFREVPGLAGVFLITGCEGLLHCYTAPAFRPENQTDCPCCRRLDPEQTVGTLVNGIAAAVKKVAPDALVTVWPYGASTWSDTHGARQRHVATFSRDCAFMANFDTDEAFEREGVRVMAEDYNLAVIGPSQVFRRQAAVAARNGLKVMAKVESGCPRDVHAIPSIPANPRWARKYAQILASGATGAMFAWQFCSFTGSLSEELAGLMSWQPCSDSEDLLRRLAARDFGTGNAESAVRAWEWFDRAWESFPYSTATSMFRRGPFGIGFAQPLILDSTRPGKLGPAFFFDPGKRVPAGTLPPARFVADSSWTYPFGADACRRALVRTIRAWARGCALLDALLDAAPTRRSTDPAAAARLDEHHALACAILCILRTALHMVQFYAVRDQYFREPSDLALARRRLTELRNIAKRELANAEEGLQCMRRNVQVGFDYANQAGFSQAMVEEKLAHTRRLIDWEIPYRMFNHSVAMHSRDEWIWDDGRKYR